MHLFSFALQLQEFCHALGWPRRFHRNTGAGAIGARQVPDLENPKLFHVYITFSLDIQTHLHTGIIIPGFGVRVNDLDVGEDDAAWAPSDEDDYESSELSDGEDDSSSDLSDGED
jgi:hypothetical protein